MVGLGIHAGFLIKATETSEFKDDLKRENKYEDRSSLMSFLSFIQGARWIRFLYGQMKYEFC